ncbi:MAG: isoleucine--tRNA ligase [Candidatus Doudnabacteria bacterium]
MKSQEQQPKLDINQQELEVLEFWNNQDIFRQSLSATKDEPGFIFYDGPPFATGTPHYGSLLPSIIKDAIPRYQTMRGRFVRRRWGWDCHGLPIENIVEEKLNISGKKQIEEIGVDKFNQTCRDNVLTYTSEWGKTINRIARWVNFDNSYKTMDSTFMESVWWGLKQVWDKGLIYEDNKVLMYCSRCETPLSNFEVAMDNSYEDVTENSVFVKFKLLAGQRIVDWLTDEQTYVLAWTTTPWTLPGNTALNIGPEIEYVVVAQDQVKYILAKSRLEILEGEYEIIMQGIEARSLAGLQYQPLYQNVIDDPDNTAHKIYIEDYVEDTDGTGVVHNAAMYGEVDYLAAKDKNLPRQHMLDHTGEFMENAPASIRGKFFKDADPIVLSELSEQGLVYKILSYTHSYPHCWRCGTPLYYSALSAWFINIQKIKPQLLENNEGINWYPEHLKHGRFAKGIETAPDWNISRNRYWATALPFWKCSAESCDNVVCVGSVEEMKQMSPNFDQVYPNYDPQNLEAIDLHKPYIDQVKLKCHKCQSEMNRIPEVVDCWVESGSMPFAELHYPMENRELFAQRFPSDFVVEYIPQTRAWFYVMHVLSTIIFGKAPFKNVVTTGTILAEDGAKMSKSKKNYPDPEIILSKYGADALRLYLLTSPIIYGEDLNFSETGVAEVNRKFSLILRNVHSFLRMYNQDKFEDTAEVPQSDHPMDRWILAKLAELHQYVVSQMDVFNTVKAGRALQEFVTELSTWYVRRNRDRIKAGDQSSQQAIKVLGYVLVEFSKLLAPFMPYLAEILYRDLTSGTSVHLQRITEPSSVDEDIINEMNNVRAIVELGLSVRKDSELKVRQALAEVRYQLASGQALAKDLELIIAEELNVKAVSSQEILERSGWATKQSENAQFKISVDTNLTAELKQEGLAREIERQIQVLRKNSGLQIGQVVDLFYTTQSQDLAQAIEQQLDKKKLFVDQISTDVEVEVDFETQASIESQPVWLGVSLK